MDEYVRLRTLLLDKEQQQIARLKVELEAIIEESRDPEQIIQKIAPLISGIFSQTLRENKEEFVEIFSPIIGDLLKSMIKNSSSEIATVIAPIMGKAITEQVKNQRDEIVDALYPVMGSMISKFVGESFKEMMSEINTKVQSTFSFETFKRKVTALVTGVSETELLLRSSSYSIQNIFLIHKETGILLSERSLPSKTAVEPEMVASMLTAIRSFANDWISKNSNHFEINEIEFGDSTIRLEVAGCCYLAIVIKGNVNRDGKQKITSVLEWLVEKHAQIIVKFSGDLSELPIEEINDKLDTLFVNDNTKDEAKEKNSWILWIFSVILLSGIFFGIYNKNLNDSAQEKILMALYKDPSLNLYAIEVEVEYPTIILNARLPAESLQEHLIEKVSAILPEYTIEDRTVLTNSLAIKEKTYLSIKRLIDTLNIDEGNEIGFKFKKGIVELNGTLKNHKLHKEIISQIFLMSGVLEVLSTVVERPVGKEMELYYKIGESELDDKNTLLLERWFKLYALNETLELYSTIDLLIIGYSDKHGNIINNEKIAVKRAKNVEKYLIKNGISSERINYIGVPSPPSDSSNKAFYSGRCVEIKWVKR